MSGDKLIDDVSIANTQRRGGKRKSSEKDKNDKMKDAGLGDSSVRSATFNMITQISFRVITFILNAFVLRHISRDVMGLINVRLNLLDDTILFLSREAFRLACLGHRGKEGWDGVLNLMWCCVPLSIVWSTVLGWVWVNILSSPPEDLKQQYETAVILVSFSGIIQMFAEVPWLIAQIFLFVRLRVIMDFIWMLTRVLFLVIAVSLYPDNVVYIWAVGHFIAGLLYVLGYYFAFFLILKFGNKDPHAKCSHSSALPFNSLRQFFPTFDKTTFPVNQEYRRVTVSFLAQGLMKQVLTEGERYLMTFLNLLSLSQQGIYDVVSNLGSLAARFIFRPIEESCYLFFSQQWVRGKDWKDQDEDMRQKVEQGLFRVLRLMVLLGLVIFTFGFSYSDLLLRIYGGPHLAVDGGTALLRAQCLLIFFLAVNGVTECFVRSVMTEQEINMFNKKLVFLSCSYLLLTWAMTSSMGVLGLVGANCVNMGIRIYFSIEIIQKTFANLDPSPIQGLFPENDMLYILLCSGTCCQLSEQYIYAWSPAVHFLLGALLFFVVVASVVIKEDFILSFLVEKYRNIKLKIKKE
ncbi:protein RFT1 homolog isoform X2 [Eurytemora carolleeae]|uniref:protein RFT1 homolog isoform X2 n=1 Tax=Eurytemora carolleeae TaxID=1294199 RepID=UPI000C75608E|nr:protein RFT1 homolog isoform X2 [Eurytemora carolleeae]|eukprot:XP_023334103.1 protein RFT1 homolog isoform X2 [Eurytemora affinis]